MDCIRQELLTHTSLARQFDEAALALEKPETLAQLRHTALATATFEQFSGYAEKGHFVEVKWGEHKGQRGCINFDDKHDRTNTYKVTFADGSSSGWLAPDMVKSSGLDETSFLIHAMGARATEVHVACKTLSPAMRGALDEARQRVARDTLPLLSLLQADPLHVQSSHLSFQEYYAARTLCEGTKLSGAPPWQWPAWWANTITIGAGMGDGFVRGVLGGAGKTGDSLDLERKIDGDRPTVIRLLSECSKVLTSLNLRNNNLDAEAARVLAAGLRGNTTLTSLNLCLNDLVHERVANAKGTREEIGDLTGTQVKLDDGRFMTCLKHDFRRLIVADLSGIHSIADALKDNTVLTDLDLSRNKLGSEGGKIFAAMLSESPTGLKMLNVRANEIGNDVKKLLKDAEKGARAKGASVSVST